MAADILWIGGGKGGVGKSMVAMAALDLLLGRGERVLLVETDTSNPDVWNTWKTWNELVSAKLVDLDVKEGWIDLLDICHEKNGCTVLINAAARNAKGVEAHGPLLESALGELGRRLITLWVINRQKDSLILLREHMRALPASAVHVLRNGYFGPEAKFDLYNDSKIRKAVESAGGRSLTFPDLADRVADDIFSRRLPIPDAVRDLPFGNRAELLRWRGEAARVLGDVI